MNLKLISLGAAAGLGLAASSCDARTGPGHSDTRSGGGPGADANVGTGGSGSSAAGQRPTVDDSLFTVQHQLASDVAPRAPTTVGIVTWSFHSSDVQRAQIEFGLDTSYGMTAPVDLEQADFRTLLLGMKPDRSYHFRIVVDTAVGTYASDDYAVETGAASNRLNLSDFRVVNDEARERGFIVTSYWQGPHASIPFIIDADGEIVWWYESNTTDIGRARMSADARNLWLVVANNSGGPVERVSMDTLDGEVYADTIASHDITPVEGPMMAYLDYGEADCDSIFEIDPSGEAVEVFDTESVIVGGRLAKDACHANALRYSRAEEVYTLSDLTNDVFVINRRGELEWRLSELVPGGNEAWGGTQHGHQLLGRGIILFANRLGDSAGVVEYTLEGQEVFRHQGGPSSLNFGDVQRLPQGNTLVTYSNDSIIQEIDPQGNLVLEIDGGDHAFGYASWRSTLYGAVSSSGR